MKLRLARKIVAIACTERDHGQYSSAQFHAALNRIERTATSRETQRYWNWLMQTIGPMGRAEIVFTGRLRDACRKHGLPLPEIE